jgi:hypothetical protein
MNSTEIEQVDFDYRTLQLDNRGFVKERALRIHDMARKTVEAIYLIGQWLTEVKEKLPHGAWLPWLATEFGWSEDTAERFMLVYRCLKSRNLRNISVDVSALYKIAARKTPEPVREDLLARATAGERITHAKTVQLTQDFVRRTDIALDTLATVVEQCRKDIELPSASDSVGTVLVTALLAFWQAIEVIRHPYMPVEQAAHIVFAERGCGHDNSFWDAIALTAEPDVGDQMSEVLANFRKMAHTISICRRAECIAA